MTLPPQPPQSNDSWQNDRLLDILGKVNTLLTQSDALNAGMAQLKSDLDGVAAAIATEIQQLKDAVAAGADLNAAVANAVTGLDAAHTRLSQSAADLAADDPAAPPAA